MGQGHGPYTSYDPADVFLSDFILTASMQHRDLVQRDMRTLCKRSIGLDNNDCINATPLCGNSTFTAASLGPVWFLKQDHHALVQKIIQIGTI
jgi:hypothetical protein